MANKKPLVLNANGQIEQLQASDTLAGVDSLLAFAQSEVSVAGATTLSSTAFGRQHSVTGSSDYAITLPAATSNTGKTIGFSFRQNSGVLVRLTGVSMGGLSDRYYMPGESLVLRSNGSTYDVESECVRKPWFKATRSANQTGVANATWTTSQYNTDTGNDPYAIYDTSTYVCTANRPGRWRFAQVALLVSDSAFTDLGGLGFRLNATSGDPGYGRRVPTASTLLALADITEELVLARGDTVQATLYIPAGGNRRLDVSYSNFQGRWIGHE